MINYNLSNIDMNKTFAEIFELNPSDYKDIPINNFNFFQATIFDLKKRNILDLCELSQLSCKEFLGLMYVGKCKLNEMLVFFYELKNKNIDVQAYKISYLHNIPLTIALNRNKIVKGDFSTVELNKKNQYIVSKYVTAQNAIGEELAEISMKTPHKVLPLINALSCFNKKQSIITTKRNVIKGLLSAIPAKRQTNSIFNYINFYPGDAIGKNTLKRIFRYNSSDLTSNEISEIIANDSEYRILIDFLRWYILLPEFYIKQLIKKTINSSIKKKIIDLRIENLSFSEIADVIKYTPNFVIEKHNEIINKFFSDNDSLAAFILFSLDSGGKKSFDETELSKEFNSLAPILTYLYTYSKNSRIKFDKTVNQLKLK